MSAQWVSGADGGLQDGMRWRCRCVDLATAASRSFHGKPLDSCELLDDVFGWVNWLTLDGSAPVFFVGFFFLFFLFSSIGRGLGSLLDGWPYCTSCSGERAALFIFSLFLPLTDWTDSDCLCVFPCYLYCPYNTAPPMFRFSAAASVQMTHVYTGADCIGCLLGVALLFFCTSMQLVSRPHFCPCLPAQLVCARFNKGQ